MNPVAAPPDQHGQWMVENPERGGHPVARGTTDEQLEALLGNRPTSTITIIWTRYRFVKTPQRNSQAYRRADSRLERPARSMQPLADRLAQRGFDAYSYDYPTSKRSLKRHSQIFFPIPELLDQLRLTQSPYLTIAWLAPKRAMASMTEEECRRICAIVMPAPNRGSLRHTWGQFAFRSFNVSLKDMTPTKRPSCPPFQILPGRHQLASLRRHDTEVQMEDTRLPDSLPHKHVVVQCSHLELLKPSKVRRIS